MSTEEHPSPVGIQGSPLPFVMLGGPRFRDFCNQLFRLSSEKVEFVTENVSVASGDSGVDILGKSTTETGAITIVQCKCLTKPMTVATVAQEAAQEAAKAALYAMVNKLLLAQSIVVCAGYLGQELLTAVAQGPAFNWEAEILKKIHKGKDLKKLKQKLEKNGGTVEEAASTYMKSCGGPMVRSEDWLNSLYFDLTRTEKKLLQSEFFAPRELSTAKDTSFLLADRGDNLPPLPMSPLELEAARRDRIGPILTENQLIRGRYRLNHEIGQGHFGVVWHAFDQAEGRDVAIKFLHRSWREEQSKIDRFRQGALVMERLNHSNIVSLIDGPVIDEAQRLYFVMDFVEGPTLEQAVQEGRMTIREKLHFIVDICDALEHAHGESVIHRDLSPSNVLLANREHAVVTDFDLVLAEEFTVGTRMGAAMGKYPFSPPELQGKASLATAASDIYAIGMIVLYMMVGENGMTEAIRNLDRAIGELALPVVARRAVAYATLLDQELRCQTIEEFRSRILEGLDVLDYLGPHGSWLYGLPRSCKARFEGSVENVWRAKRHGALDAMANDTAIRILDTIAQDHSSTLWEGKRIGSWVGFQAVAMGLEGDNEREVYELLTMRRFLLLCRSLSQLWELKGGHDVLWAVLAGHLSIDELREAVDKHRHIWGLRIVEFAKTYGLSDIANITASELLLEEQNFITQQKDNMGHMDPPSWLTDNVSEWLNGFPEDLDRYVPFSAIERKANNRLGPRGSETEAWARALGRVTSGSPSYRVKCLEAWSTFIDEILGYRMGSQWSELAMIAMILRRCGETGMGHALFADSGGLDLNDARVLPGGQIELNFGGTRELGLSAYLGRPRRLTLEVFDGDETREWSYLFIEFDDYPEEGGTYGFVRYGFEVMPGQFALEANHSRAVGQIMGGNMIVVAKASLYNANPSTYDGRQGARSRSDFRDYASRTIEMLRSHCAIPDQLGRLPE